MCDKCFDILANKHRRRLLFELLDRVQSETVESISADAQAESFEEDNARLLLHHVHIPKLADAGVVSWDRDDGIVTPGPAFDQIRPLLEGVEPVLDEDRSTC